MIIEEECKKCGLCCWWDPETISGDKDSLIKPDGFCIHRGKNGCEIYEIRSQGCRDFERGCDLCLQIRKDVVRIQRIKNLRDKTEIKNVSRNI